MIDDAIVLGVVPVGLGIVTVVLGDATHGWIRWIHSAIHAMRIGFVGNGREETGLVGVSRTVGRSIASEEAIRSGMSASYANPRAKER